MNTPTPPPDPVADERARMGAMFATTSYVNDYADRPLPDLSADDNEDPEYTDDVDALK